MKLLSNAESIIEKEFRLDNVIATKKTLETNIANSYKTKFFQELQIYVTKIGIALSKCVQDVKMTTNTYLGSIDYVCKKILKNRQLYEVMRAIKINYDKKKLGTIIVVSALFCFGYFIGSDWQALLLKIPLIILYTSIIVYINNLQSIIIKYIKCHV